MIPCLVSRRCRYPLTSLSRRTSGGYNQGSPVAFCRGIPRSEPPINPAPVSGRDDVDHLEVVYDREDGTVIPDPERVGRGIARSLQSFEVFLQAPGVTPVGTQGQGLGTRGGGGRHRLRSFCVRVLEKTSVLLLDSRIKRILPTTRAWLSGRGVSLRGQI